MSLAPESIHEIRILSLFNPKSALEGIKVHHQATAEDVEATQRLFDKGLITLADGGYLTPLGQEAVRKLEDLTIILTSEKKSGQPAGSSAF